MAIRSSTLLQLSDSFDMGRYRIGNDMTVLWSINDRNGAALPLNDKEVHLYYTCERGRFEADIEIQDDNVVIWHFLGSQQRTLGSYTLTLEILQSQGKRSIKKDICNAFVLVGKECEEKYIDGEAHINEGGEITLVTDLDIYRISPIIPYIVEDENGIGHWYVDGVNTGVRSTGKSAYEIAVEFGGYEGTEEEFGESLAQIAKLKDIETDIKKLQGSKFGHTRERKGKIQFFANEATAAEYDINPETNLSLLLGEVNAAVYNSQFEDKTLTMPSTVGGIIGGTRLSELEGKTVSSILDGLLFPKVNPTFTAPYASIALKNYADIQEVGAAAPTEDNFTTGFNAGAINLNGVKQSNRAGVLIADDSFIYYNDSADNTTLPAVVALGSTSYKYRASYAEGPQPKDNMGNDFGSPLAAGSVDSSPVYVNGTYPWYASTSNATIDVPIVKQSLVPWNEAIGSMSTGNFTLQPSGTLPQVFLLPRKINGLRMLNSISNQMEVISLEAYTEAEEVMNGHTYYRYTYSGPTRGSVTLLARF